MNRYFVFKKVRSLDVKKMSDIRLNREDTTRTIVDNIMEEEDEKEKDEKKPEKKKTVRKTKKSKIILQK